MSKEKRKFTRVSVRVLAETSSEEDSIGFFGRVRDISLMSAFIDGVKGFSKGEACRVELLLGEPGRELRIRATGAVTRIEDAGIGVQFENVEAKGLPHLISLILDNTSVREPVLQELHEIFDLKVPPE